MPLDTGLGNVIKNPINCMRRSACVGRFVSFRFYARHFSFSHRVARKFRARSSTDRSSVGVVWKIFLIILPTIPCHVILNFQQEARLSGCLNIKSRALCVLLLADIYFPEYDMKQAVAGILVTSREIFHFYEIFEIGLVPSFTTLEAFSPVKSVFIETPCTGYFCCAFHSRR